MAKNPLPFDRRVQAPDTPKDPVGKPMGGVDVEEYISVDPDPDEITITPDEEGGGIWVDVPTEREESAPPDKEFYANLAAVLPKFVRDRIVMELLRKIEDDKTARGKRDEQYEEGLRRTGMGNDAPGGADFEGASKTVHPMMAEACVDYNARIMKELFPPSGPVKPRIIGEPTAEKAAKAKRKTEHMNYQLTTQIKEARATLETTFTQVPLGGSQFIHLWWDHGLKRPRMEFRSVDKMLIPFAAADFASASRRTYQDTVTLVEFKRRVEQGLYVDIEAPPASQLQEPTKSEIANQKIQGLSDPGTNEDKDRDVYETMTYLEVTDDCEEYLDHEEIGGLYPYIISMDPNSKDMLAMYRCWEPNDKAREPIEHDFEFPFLPWRGALSIGFPQLIGGLSAAATGALRALLDSAHVNNVVSAVMKKGAGVSGQSKQMTIGTIMELDTGLETASIRDAIMPFPFNPPSPVLFQLLGFVVEAAKGIVRTSMDEQPTNGGSPVPVGTQMSRVEEGLVVFSAIHGRAHAAFNRLLAGLHRLNRLYLPETLKVDADGKELMVRRADYEGPCDVQPVSDPTVYSDMQRFNQLNYIQSRMMVMPQLWKAREVELAGLKLIKWPDPESLLQDAPTPHELNQVNENLALALGRPVSVFPEQDHAAHLQVLIDFMEALGMNPLFAPKFLGPAIAHATEHIAYLYLTMTVATVTAAAGEDAASLMSNDQEVKREYDRLLAAASKVVIPKVRALLAQAMPVLQRAQQMAQQFMPKPPMDPAAAAVQAAAAETARKGQADQANNAINQAKLQMQQQENAIAADRVAAMREGQQIQAQTQLQKTQLDNESAEAISDARVESGAGSGYRNGESM